MFRELLSLLKSSSPPVGTDERRDTVRLHCQLDVLLWVDDEIHMATVVDVTLTGLCLELDHKLKVDQMISLARDDFGHPWEGRVLWCKTYRKNGRKYRVGVGYPPNQEMLRCSWLQPALKQTGFEAEDPGEKRRLLRVSGRVPCLLKGLTGEVYSEGEMLDLSLGGAKFESAMHFHEGLTVEFETHPQGGLSPLKGLAKVMTCRQKEETGLWRSGLRFKEIKEQEVRKYMAGMLASR